MSGRRRAYQVLHQSVSSGEYKSASGGKEMRLNYPVCGDQKGNLWINRETGKFICNRGRCHFKGTLRTPDSAHTVSTEANVPDAVETYPLDSECQAYLRSRGVPESAWRWYGLRVMYDRKEQKRIYIPCYVDGDLVYWQARSLDPTHTPKYWGTGAKDRALLNWDYLVKLTPIPELHICEGPFSAIAAGPQATAIYGNIPTEHQIRALSRLKPQRIYVAIEGDVPVSVALVAHALTGICPDVRVVPLRGKEDPANLAPGEYAHRVIHAEPATFGSLIKRLLS